MGNTLPKIPEIPEQQQQELWQRSSEEDENQEFTCEICIEPAPTSDKKFKNGNKCSHPFCTDCSAKYIRAKLDDGGDGDIKCPAVGCGHSLDPAACAAVVGPELFVRWCDALCEAAILGRERCYCPYRNCNVLIVNECGGTVKKSKCPSCNRLLCFQCQRVWHAGFGCEESGVARDSNDVAFGRLVEQGQWMRCPNCRHFIELLDGCKIVRCRCGIIFCYKCGKQVHMHGCNCESPISSCLGSFIICIIAIIFLFVIFFTVKSNHKSPPK